MPEFKSYPRLLYVLPSFLIIVSSLIILTFFPRPKPTTDNLQPTTDKWQTYQNNELMFEIKYPDNLWSGKLPSMSLGQDTFELLTISDKNRKSIEETAFFLSVYVAPGENVLGSGKTEILNILDKYLNYYSLKNKYGEGVLGNFLGDPPQSYYYVYLPLKKTQEYPPEYLVFKASIPNSDYPAYGGDYSQRDLIKHILSTFKFTQSKCKPNEYLKQCKLGLCCCPMGALCD